MKFDFSYIDMFFAALDEGQDISRIKNTIGYKTISKHVEMTGSEFSIKNIKEAINGNDNAGYGLRNLSHNIENIRQLVENLRNRTTEWRDIICKEVLNIFNAYDFSNTIICPVIGYDIGIGINDVACINLNTEISLKDVKEIFSISIHETTHTVTENILGPVFFSLNTKQDILNTINNLIAYEGIGIFSAFNYRLKNQLSNMGSPLLDDYNVSDKRYNHLLKAYKDLKLLANDGEVTLNDMLNKAFSGIRLTHRLGYAIVEREYQKHGLERVREIAKMDCNDFVMRYLQ